MRMTEHDIWVFLAGAALGSIITYWSATREQRAILRIRQDITFLGCFHKLTPAQFQKTSSVAATKKIATDDQVLAVYRWALHAKKHSAFKRSLKKVSPTRLAAETIICEEFLGLSSEEAASILVRLKSLDDFRTLRPASTNHQDLERED